MDRIIDRERERGGEIENDRRRETVLKVQSEAYRLKTAARRVLLVEIDSFMTREIETERDREREDWTCSIVTEIETETTGEKKEKR